MEERDRDWVPGHPTAQVNYRVCDLDRLLVQRRAEGVVVSPKVEESKYGRFGWAEYPNAIAWNCGSLHAGTIRRAPCGDGIVFADPAIPLISRQFRVTDRANGTMPTYSLQYRFRQPLRAPARAAYAWCTDYQPGDGKLFPERWERSVRWLSEDAVVLTDTTYPSGQARRIHRLVRLSPSDLEWTNTHLDGPFRHSQYWYRIVPDDPRSCHLEFRAHRLVTSPRRPSASESARIDRPGAAMGFQPVATANGSRPRTGPRAQRGPFSGQTVELVGSVTCAVRYAAQEGRPRCAGPNRTWTGSAPPSASSVPASQRSRASPTYGSLRAIGFLGRTHPVDRPRARSSRGESTTEPGPGRCVDIQLPEQGVHFPAVLQLLFDQVPDHRP